MRSMPLPTNRCSFISTYEPGSCVEAQCAVCRYINKRHMNLCTFKKTSRYSYPHTNRGVTGHCASTYELRASTCEEVHMWRHCASRYEPRAQVLICASRYEPRTSTCEEALFLRGDTVYM